MGGQKKKKGKQLDLQLALPLRSVMSLRAGYLSTLDWPEALPLNVKFALANTLAQCLEPLRNAIMYRLVPLEYSPQEDGDSSPEQEMSNSGSANAATGSVAGIVVATSKTSARQAATVAPMESADTACGSATAVTGGAACVAVAIATQRQLHAAISAQVRLQVELRVLALHRAELRAPRRKKLI